MPLHNADTQLDYYRLNTADIYKKNKTITNILYAFILKLECGQMPNVMVALPNTGGALCSTPQSLADAHYWSAVRNAAKTQNPLKFAGVPQTNETISAASGPKFTILWGHVEEILLLNKFFSDCRYVP